MRAIDGPMYESGAESFLVQAANRQPAAQPSSAGRKYEEAKARALESFLRVAPTTLLAEEELRARASRLEALEKPEQRAFLLLNMVWQVRVGVVKELVQRVLRQGRPLASTEDTCARLAVECACAIPAEGVSASVVHDLRAEALAYLANLIRVKGRHREAASFWPRVWIELHQGSGDAELQARLLSLEGSLHIAERRLEQAAATLEAVWRLYDEDLGDRHCAGRTLAKLAIVRSCQGETSEALRLTLEAGQWIDPAREPELCTTLAVNLTMYSAEAMDAEAGVELVERFRPLFEESLAPHLQQRIAWMHGLLLAATGRYSESVEILEEVRDCFLKDEVIYNAILISLDLARIHLKHRRYHYVRWLAQWMLTVVGSPAIPARASSALGDLCRSILGGEVSEERWLALIRALHVRLAPPAHPARFGSFV